MSSDRQDVDLSVAAQLRALRDYAEKNGYIVAREYVDEAESGRIADRPQFQRMLDEASKPEAPFQEILRRKGVRVVSITEHADDTPIGKLMEAIIESVDEFYSENLAQEVVRGMREAASRGFWMTTYAPYGYKRVHVQDGAAKRPKLELNPPADAVVRRVFDMVLQGKSILDVTKTLNAEGIPTTNGKKWLKTTIHTMLSHEAYTGTVVWGANAKDGAPPVRVEDAHPAIVSKRDFQKARKLLRSRAPKKVNPRRASSPYLLSGIAKCETCGKAMTAAEAKSGKYTYYICHSLLKRGKGACKTPRLNAKNFEKLIVNEIRENVLTESNIRDLVKLLDEEMDGVARDQRERLQNIEEELEDVKKRLARIWNHIETTDTEMADASDRIREHRERKEKLEIAAEEARALLNPNPPKDTDGRREDSGRGWVRELQGRWPGVVGRPADGLQSPHRAPKALCGSCDARDGERIRSRGLSRPGWREIAGTLGQLQAGRQAGNGMACSRAKARLNWVSQGQRRGRCKVRRRAERVIRPTRAKTRRLRVLVVTIC